MTITKIVEQQRRKGWYAIHIDGVYAFSLGESALLESGLTPRQELSEQEVKYWKNRAADDKHYDRALRFVALRQRSRWEVETYLVRRKQASPALAHDILNKLSDIGLLDDEAFAKAWVRSRRLLRPTSKRKLQQELRAKHVAEDVISGALATTDANEQDILRSLVERKRKLPKYRDDPLKLMQYLARQGFHYGDIQAALRPPDK